MATSEFLIQSARRIEHGMCYPKLESDLIRNRLDVVAKHAQLSECQDGGSGGGGVMRTLIASVALFINSPLAAQSAASPIVTVVDQARLKVASALIDQIFPPATREQMIVAMIAPITANIRQSLTQNPKFAAALASNPSKKIIFDKFMDRQLARSTETLKAQLPDMSDAMARAYARRFDVDQMKELSAFFATPTGQAYIGASMTIMSDPDIAAWQRGLMTASMSHVQDDVASLMTELTALSTQEKDQ